MKAKVSVLSVHVPISVSAIQYIVQNRQRGRFLLVRIVYATSIGDFLETSRTYFPVTIL